MNIYQKGVIVVLAIGVVLAHANTKDLNKRLTKQEELSQQMQLRMNAQTAALREDLHNVTKSLDEAKNLLDEINTPLKMNKDTIEKNLLQVLEILEKIEQENPIQLIED